MKKRIGRFIMLAVAVILITVTAAVCAAASSGESGKWIAAWGTGITEIGVGGYNDIGVILTSATCRSVLTPTASGTRLRLKLSNVYGETDLRIDKMTVAKTAGGSRIHVETLVDVCFNGSRNVVVPVGKEIYSDPVEYEVTAMEPISVSTYFSKPNEIRTGGFSGGYTYLAVPGNYTDKTTLGLMSIKLQYGLVSVVPVLSSLDVYSEDKDAYSVVVIGDSTVANEFPYYLAKQITCAGYDNVGIVGKGIIGNSLLSDGYGIGEKIYGDSLLKRFDIDALKQAGVKYVVVKLGCNDIVHPKSGNNAAEYGAVSPTAQQMIDGYTELSQRCRDAGIKIVCIAIMQWKGYTRDFFGTGAKYMFSDEDWALADEVNQWMATTDTFDYFVNLNPYSQDPNDSQALLSKYTKDGCHPNDELQILWSKVFPLESIGVVVKPLQLQLNRAFVSLHASKKIDLDEKVMPENSVDKTVKWASSNTKVAKVSSAGVVTAVGNGSAAITCTTVLGGIRARCLVRVSTPVSGVRLSRASLTLYTGKSYTLTATVLPSGASNKAVTWSSSNTSVACVNSAGLITTRKAGTAVITCKTADGGFKAACRLTVKDFVSVTGVKLNVSARSVYVKSACTLTPAVYPANASNKNVKWSSSNPRIASVSSDGVVTGRAAGTCTITCTTVNGAKRAVCTVKVIPRS